MRIQVVGTGMYAPPKVETAEELSERCGKSVRWILQRTGVARRHVAEEPTERMAAQAARLALGSGGPPDLLLNCSLTPVQLIPDTSVFQLQELGISGIPSFSIHATCLSFLVGLHTAGGLVASGAYRRVLVVSSEIGSVSRNWREPESAVLIGDGAGAAVIAPTPDGESSALLAWDHTTWPSGAGHAEIRGCGTRRSPLDPETVAEDYLFSMNGPAIYRHAYKHVHQMLERLFAQAGLTPADVDLVVPHQASGNALLAVQKLGFSQDRVVNVLAEYGNCIAASLPMALGVAAAEGRLKRGDLVLLMGTGAGLSVAGALLRW